MTPPATGQAPNRRSKRHPATSKVVRRDAEAPRRQTLEPPADAHRGTVTLGTHERRLSSGVHGWGGWHRLPTKVPGGLPTIGEDRLTRGFTVLGQFQETQVY